MNGQYSAQRFLIVLLLVVALVSIPAGCAPQQETREKAGQPPVVSARTVPVAELQTAAPVEPAVETPIDTHAFQRSDSQSPGASSIVEPAEPPPADSPQDVVITPAAPPEPTGDSWAILIGINNYEDTTVPPLRYAARDAETLCDTLVEHCLFSRDRIALLTDNRGTPPTLSNIDRELDRILAQVSPGDTVVFFFSGLGVLHPRQNLCFMPIDCLVQNLQTTGIAASKVRQRLEGCPAGTKIMLLDCSYAGGNKIADPATARTITTQGVAIVSSCRGEETSFEWPEKEHGLFSYWVIEGIRGQADADRNLAVTFEELYMFAYKNVQETAVATWGTSQSPTRDMNDVAGDIIVARLQ